MRTWLAKFRISTALDSNVPRREKLPRAQVDCDDVRRYEESLHSLDRRLMAAQPAKPVPAALHASVMRAVRSAAESQERQSARWGLRWLPVPALAMLVICGLWWSLNQPRHEPPSLTAAATVLAQGHELAQKTPDVVLAPLSQEMKNLNRDFQNAVDFLVASVP
jgi:hypothetical protein